MPETLSREEASVKEVPFDSDFFGRKVGSIALSNVSLSSSLEEQLVLEAKESGFKIVYLSTSTEVKTDRFRYVASLEKWIGEPEDVVKRAEPARSRFQDLIRRGGSWGAIGSLLSHSSPTRFSLDEHFESSTVIDHKLHILRSYAQKFPDGLRVAYEDKSESISTPIGFHMGYPVGREWIFYEIVLHPSVRTGLPAVALVGSCLRDALGERSDLEIASAKIYRHNTSSKKFFRHLGLKDSGEVQHFYHLHIDS